MIPRVMEIGVAVPDLAQSAQKMAFVLGGRTGESIAAPRYGMTARMVRIGNIELELMEPLNQKGLIKKFIRQRGPGLHHIAFEVDDIVQTMNDLRRQGLQTLNEEPVQAHGVKAAFLNPKSFGGVLLELIEGSPRWVDNRPLPIDLQPPVQGNCLGVEGLLAIGIMVEDVAAAVETYATAFNAPRRKPFSPYGNLSNTGVCRVGNADLIFMPMPCKETESGFFLSVKRPGIHHIVLKVQNLDRALAFLEDHKVEFESDRNAPDGAIRYLALNPAQFDGVPILLKDSIL